MNISPRSAAASLPHSAVARRSRPVKTTEAVAPGRDMDGFGPGSVAGDAGGDADPADDPYSPGFHHFASAIGALIAVLVLSVPIATVLAARPVPSASISVDESQPAAGIPSARAGESGGGDPRRLP